MNGSCGCWRFGGLDAFAANYEPVLSDARRPVPTLSSATNPGSMCSAGFAPPGRLTDGPAAMRCQQGGQV